MERNHQVIYLISGPAHIPYVTVSIWSLRTRAKYTGPVIVFSWPESTGFLRALERDDRLNIWVSEREPKLRRAAGLGGNSQGLDRIDLAMSLDSDVVLYIDADSSVHGDITPMFAEAERCGYCATQWCDWWTNNGKTRGRIRALADVESLPRDYVHELITKQYPSLNCGVFATKPDSPLLPQWYDWCKACGPMFISDERTQHLLMVKYPEQMSVMMGGSYNCSHKYRPANLNPNDVNIWHYHGDSNTKPGKSPEAMAMWSELWKECLEKDIGSVRSWWQDCGNRHLPKMMATGEFADTIMCG